MKLTFSDELVGSKMCHGDAFFAPILDGFNFGNRNSTFCKDTSAEFCNYFVIVELRQNIWDSSLRLKWLSTKAYQKKNRDFDGNGNL